MIPDRPGAQATLLRGSVEIVCDDMTLSADEVRWERDIGRVVATGHVSLHQGDLTIYADRAEMNSKTRLGTFYRAAGSARIAADPSERSLFGTLEPDVMFHGEQVERTAPTTYKLTNGGFTTCAQPTPRWQMTGSKGTITLDKRVVMTNVVLRVKDVPLFYVPLIYYPINKEERSTGFLLPTYGASTLRGSSLSNAFFWAIGRSQDATFYHDWFTSTGHGAGAEYRYVASGGSRGRANFYLLNEHAQQLASGATIAAHRSYRVEGSVNQVLPRYFSLVGRMNYFTDAAIQQIYQNVTDYSQRDRTVSATLTGTVGRFQIRAIGEQRDLFYGVSQGQRTGRAPLVWVGLRDKPLGRTKIYVGANAEAAYLVRQDDITRPETNRSLWRFDANPTIRAPLSTLPYLTADSSASWRITRWLETLDPVTGEQVPIALHRQLFEMRAQVGGPKFERIFRTPNNGYADRFRHSIEPSFSIQRTTAFRDRDRVVKNDYAIDSLVGGVTTMNYRLTNRVSAGRRKLVVGVEPSPGVPRQILSVDISQSYYSDSLAAAVDPEFQLTGTATRRAAKGTFSPVQITTTGQPTDTTSVQFRMDIDSKYRAVRTLSASGSVGNPLASVTAGWSKRRLIAGLPGFDTIGSEFVNASTTVRTRENGLGGTYAINLDVENRTVLQQRIVAYYNTQCCGLSFDWQTIKTPLFADRGVPSDRRFSLSFTLAGIGSFSNPMGSFGGR